MPDSKPSVLAGMRSARIVLATLLLTALVAACTDPTTATSTTTTRAADATIDTAPSTTTTTTPERPDLSGELDETLDRLAQLGDLRIGVAEITEGDCHEIATRASDEPAPIAAVVRMYVLAAVGESVARGGMNWDDEVVIRDGLKSVPAGPLNQRSAGEVVSVRETAELMISSSDNTATDHLIDLVGREAVVAAMMDHGHRSSELNIPLMTTRELTALKVGPASGLRIQWLQGDEEARRSILDQISEITPGDLPVHNWVTPVDPDLLSWFASPTDLCSLAAGLIDLADRVPAVRTILESTPDPETISGPWDRMWFSTGTEPGLQAVWMVAESDRRWFVITGSVVNPDSSFDADEARQLFTEALDLIAP